MPKRGGRSKEIEQLLDELRERGWRIACNSNHYKAFSPNKNIPVVTIAKTPSDWRAHLNARALIERLERAAASGVTDGQP